MLTVVMDFAGQSNINPRLGRLFTDEHTLSQVAAAGFLDMLIQSENLALLESDFMAVAATNGNGWYKPVFTAGSCQLVAF